MQSYLEGEFYDACDRLSDAQLYFRQVNTDANWALLTTELFIFWSMYFTGQIERLSRGLPDAWSKASQTNNWFSSSGLTLSYQLLLIAQNRLETAEAVVMADENLFDMSEVPIQTANQIYSRSELELLRGKAESGWKRLVLNWKALRSQLILSVPIMAISMSDMRGRCAVGALETAMVKRDQRRLIADINRCTSWLRSYRRPYATAYAFNLSAGNAYLQGNLTEAMRCLTEAVEIFRATRLMLRFHCSQWILGRLMSSQVGIAKLQESEAWMRSQGIVEVRLMVDLHTPGFKKLA